MAKIFTISVAEGATIYVDLITGLDNNSDTVPELIAGSYQHVTTSHDSETTISFRTIADGVTTTEASDMIGRMEKVLDWVHVAQQDPTSLDSLWLVRALNSEEQEQQVILSWTRRDEFFVEGSTMGEGKNIISIWTLTMLALAEGTSGQALLPASGIINLEGGTYDSAAQNKGTTDGRIASMTIASTESLRNVWFGIKRGSHTGFNPRMECAGNFTNILDSTSGASGESSFGTVITSTFGTTAMSDRFRVTVDSGQDSYLVGTYLVLYRARYSGAVGTEIRVRVATSFDRYSSNAPRDYGQDVFMLGSTAQAIWEAGVFQFPPEGFRGSRQALDSLGLTVSAERITGTGNLISDSFYLIPWEHHATLTGIQHESGDATYLRMDEYGMTTSYTHDTSPVKTTHCEHSLNRWQFPLNQKTFWIVMGEASLGSVSGVLSVGLGILPRYYGSNPD